MKQGVDLQTAFGFASATGIPPLISSTVKFLHPSLYTLACGMGYFDGAPQCYADERLEALLVLSLSAIAVGYGLYTFVRRLRANPTPPEGAVSANIPCGTIPVVGFPTAAGGQQAAIAGPSVVASSTVRQLAPADAPSGQ